MAAESPVGYRGENASTGGLHRPRRALVGLGELLVACCAVWAAFAVWSYGITTATTDVAGGDPQSITRYHGNWIAAAIGLATLAAILALDALRQCILAARTRSSGR